MSIKIKMGPGGKIDPEVMRLLGKMAEHRDGCPRCQKAVDYRNGDFCNTGMGILTDLGNQPSVSDGADLEKKINESN